VPYGSRLPAERPPEPFERPPRPTPDAYAELLHRYGPAHAAARERRLGDSRAAAERRRAVPAAAAVDAEQTGRLQALGDVP